MAVVLASAFKLVLGQDPEPMQLILVHAKQGPRACPPNLFVCKLFTLTVADGEGASERRMNVRSRQEFQLPREANIHEAARDWGKPLLIACC